MVILIGYPIVYQSVSMLCGIACLQIVCWRNYCEWKGDGNSFKRCPLSLQDMAFCRLKDSPLYTKRIPLAKSSEISENRK